MADKKIIKKDKNPKKEKNAKIGEIKKISFLKEQRLKRLFKKEKRKTAFRKGFPEKKAQLAKHARQTRWAPVWAVLKKFGPGKKIHPSAITKYKRSWRRTKLHLKPRQARPRHLG